MFFPDKETVKIYVTSTLVAFLSSISISFTKCCPSYPVHLKGIVVNFSWVFVLYETLARKTVKSGWKSHIKILFLVFLDFLEVIIVNSLIIFYDLILIRFTKEI